VSGLERDQKNREHVTIGLGFLGHFVSGAEPKSSLVTGIHPFLSTKVLRCVASSLPPQPPPQPSTPQNPAPAFNETVLTSSRNNYNAVHQANVALNTLLDPGNPIPIPAKNYVNCLMRHVVRLHTRNTLVERENDDHKALSGARKHRLSGTKTGY